MGRQVKTRKYGPVDLPEDFFRHQVDQIWVVSVFGGAPFLGRLISFEGEAAGGVEVWRVANLLLEDELLEPRLVDTTYFIHGPLPEMEVLAWISTR